MSQHFCLSWVLCFAQRSHIYCQWQKKKAETSPYAFYTTYSKRVCLWFRDSLMSIGKEFRFPVCQIQGMSCVKLAISLPGILSRTFHFTSFGPRTTVFHFLECNKILKKYKYLHTSKELCKFPLLKVYYYHHHHHHYHMDKCCQVEDRWNHISNIGSYIDKHFLLNQHTITPSFSSLLQRFHQCSNSQLQDSLSFWIFRHVTKTELL
jgi:hypothetical protein